MFKFSDLTSAEVDWEREVRAKCLDVYIFWRQNNDPAGENELSWNMWGLLTRLTYQETFADPDKLTAAAINECIHKVEAEFRSITRYPTPSLPDVFSRH